jgi:hypothetical protein
MTPGVSQAGCRWLCVCSVRGDRGRAVITLRELQPCLAASPGYFRPERACHRGACGRSRLLSGCHDEDRQPVGTVGLKFRQPRRTSRSARSERGSTLESVPEQNGGYVRALACFSHHSEMAPVGSAAAGRTARGRVRAGGSPRWLGRRIGSSGGWCDGHVEGDGSGVGVVVPGVCFKRGRGGRPALAFGGRAGGRAAPVGVQRGHAVVPVAGLVAEGRLGPQRADRLTCPMASAAGQGRGRGGGRSWPSPGRRDPPRHGRTGCAADRP